MKSSDYLALFLGILSLGITLFVHFYKPQIALKEKKLQIRLKYREELFNSILKFRNYVNESKNWDDINSYLNEINVLIQLYGFKKEIDSFNNLRKSVLDHINKLDKVSLENYNKNLKCFFDVSFTQYRKELKMDKYNFE